MASKEESWQIPILTRENYETWFRRYMVELRGKGVYYVIEKKLHEHAEVATVGDLTDALEEFEIADSGTATSLRINIDKKAAYLKDEATAIRLMFKALSIDDQALYDEYTTAFTLWAYLKKKYLKVDATAANIYMTKIQMFTFESGSTITSAWDKLKDHRRKLAAAKPSAGNAYDDDALLLVLIRALPTEYKVTIDTLNAQRSLTVDERLQTLEAKYADIQEEEHAHPTFRVKKHDGKYVLPQHRARQDSESSSDNAKRYECHLCGQSGHFLRHCPDLEKARRIIRGLNEGKKEVHSSRLSSKSRSSSKQLTSEQHLPTKKSSSGKKSRGHVANDDDDVVESSEQSDFESVDEEEETVLLTKELIGRANPSVWPADTGASSHMSDQASLFRRMIPIKRRKIKVGGGVMYANHKGTVDMVCKDGSSMLLSGVLYVPGLGINLLSARRVCQAGLKGYFGATEMYFKHKHGKKKIITATMNDGLYIVTHVAEGYEDTAFAGAIANEAEPVNVDMQDAVEHVERDEPELTLNEKEYYLLMHRRFSHLGPEKLRNLHKVTTLSRPIKTPSKKEICEVCSLTKMTNLIPKQLSPHKLSKLALIQFDVAGPFPISLRGNRYFMLIIDSWTREEWVLCLKQKSDAQKALMTWKTDTEFQVDAKIMAARSDNAPELIQAVEQWREKGAGTQSQLTTVASSHQNGPAERNIRTAEADMRAMLKEAGLPMEFWDEAVEHDAYIRNRTATGPVIDGSVVTPHEAFTGVTPSIDRVRVWGSKCYSYINPKTIPNGQRSDKGMDTGRVGIFMGYSPTTTKQFKVYSPELGYTHRSSRVIINEKVKGGTVELRLRKCEAGPQGTFNEHADRNPRGRPKKEQPTVGPPASPPAQPSVQPTQLKPKTVPQVVVPHFVPPTNVPRFNKDDEAQEISKPVPTPSEIPIESPPQNQTKADDAIKDAVPDLATVETDKEPIARVGSNSAEAESQPEAPRYFTRSKRKRSETSAKETERLQKIVKAMMAQVDLTMSDEDINELGISTEDIEILEQAFPATEINGIKIPQTYKEAINDPQYSKQWKNAMNEELISLLENGTWKEVVPPKDVNLVSTKWVYLIKTKVDGTIERFKARLVARGFSQVHGQDYTETFAPTVRMDTLRLFLAAVAAEDLECAQFDIKNAFTESDLKEKIYLTAPKGVEVKKGCVLQVLRSLYGLKQAARDWNLLIKRELLNWGFVQSLADPCMFRHEERGIKLLVYVDDIVAAARKQDQIDWFYKQLSGRFNTKHLGEIGKILGVRVTRDRANRTIYIDQEQYLRAVLDRFGITQKTHKDKKIPAADYESFRPATKDDTRINITEYQQGIGSLMFAMVLTRPDIAFTLGKLSQYMSDPAEHHGHALKNLMRYLNSTITQKLCYSPGGAYKHFVVYSDADWASDKVDRKSISGSVVMFYGGPISWSSKKQRSVATSSCESEYMALSTCTKQGQWVAQIFRDLGLAKYIGKDPNCVDMLGDNQGSLALVKNPRLHERSKHIDICYHFIRDLEEQGKLSVTYIPTADMIADGMTKPLQRVAFERFKNQMGMTTLEA
jgi:Reverse transcriptase (RNA-dependent DNA polymerase)/gag-polypeptide of LTR copia-type